MAVLASLSGGVAIPVEFVAGEIGRPLPAWFRTAAIAAVSVTAVALTANLVYELKHGRRHQIGHPHRG